MASPMLVLLTSMAVARMSHGAAHENAAQRGEIDVSAGSGNSDSPYTHINWPFPTPMIISFALSSSDRSLSIRRARSGQTDPNCTWVSPTTALWSSIMRTIGLCIHSGRRKDVNAVGALSDMDRDRRGLSGRLRFPTRFDITPFRPCCAFSNRLRPSETVPPHIPCALGQPIRTIIPRGSSGSRTCRNQDKVRFNSI